MVLLGALAGDRVGAAGALTCVAGMCLGVVLSLSVGGVIAAMAGAVYLLAAAARTLASHVSS